MKENRIIEIHSLTKQYADKVAVNDLNLTLYKGEIFGLLGPNGAGKTTTILMLLGLTEPTSGYATISGMNCTQNPLDIKRIVGYMPDNVGFYKDMTGRQNLRFTGKLNGLSGTTLESQIESLLKRVNMLHAADEKVLTYSKGMRQRLGIADVLMKNPEIIIMDEPTLGLDPEGMHELLALIKDLSEIDRKTILISSHQLHQIQKVCDRVGIFVDGHLMAIGTISDLEEHIKHAGRYYLEIETTPCDANLFGMLTKQPGIEHIEKNGNMFLITCKFDIRQHLTSFLGQNGYTIMRLYQRGGDLDEIYRRYFEIADATVTPTNTKYKDINIPDKRGDSSI